MQMADGQNSVYTREQLLELVAEHEEHEREITAAKAVTTSLVRARTQWKKNRVEALGVPYDILLEAVRESKMSGSERERLYEHRARMLAFLDRPIPTYQQDFFESPEERRKGMVARLRVIDGMGEDAGLQGFDRHESNTYSPGSEEYQRFDTGWLRGDEKREAKSKAQDAPAQQASRGRRRRKAAEPAKAAPVEDWPEARRLGLEDGVWNERLHADLFPQGSGDHPDYELGFEQGQKQRAADEEPRLWSTESRRIPEPGAEQRAPAE